MNINTLDNPSGFSKSIIINSGDRQDFLKLNTDQVKFLSEKKISNSDLFEIEFLSTAKSFLKAYILFKDLDKISNFFQIIFNEIN